MGITIKSENEIKKIRKAGLILAKTHELLAQTLKPGISTIELDQIAEEFIRSQGAAPSFKGLYGFPASICTSINEEVVHGIPSKKVKLKEGDIISIDIGVYLDGFHSDGAKTYAVGEIPRETKKLIDVTRESFYKGLQYAKAGNHLYEISTAIQQYVEANGFSVVRDLVGHGVGKKLHEDPQIPNYKLPGRGPKLQKGMVLAIEPMVNMGTYEVRILSNNTVVTRDGSLSAHYEHTIAITDGEPEILTIL
ncbi:type I methionyl aminopeptidase [Defluviitalea phaphyphila]|uniref:type I methionyl aminopeptidase n=1 Tax=Defluviitalea phaphyphila TaxID=1473580 RepID=UPI000A009544|nr:type I methionyl aminopeptidase [Defluviitalea phaphyphila]